MKDIYVIDVIEKCGGRLVCGDNNAICDNFKIDTREIKENDTFVGIKGENFDGNAMYEEAFENGASTCILQEIDIDDNCIEKYKNKNIIIVKDTIKALGLLAKYKREMFNIPVVGVTGSVGKTSTKDIIASVISKKYNTLKTEGNFNSDIGLPLTILRLKEEHEAAVIEMGMNHKGEIDYLSNIAKPTVSVITNVGTSHIGNLGSRENILKAKLEILNGMKENGVLVYNNDNDMLNNNKDLFKKYKSIGFGIDNPSDVMALNINIGTNSSSFDVSFNNNKYNINVPVSGKHFVYNALCAICVGREVGIDINDIIAGINEFSLTKNRMEVDNFKDNITIINDAYNASYDSMEAALEFLGNFKDKYKIAVLGDMLELGEFSNELHLKVGKSVYENNIDLLVTVGDYSKKIAEGACILGMPEENVKSVDNNGDAIKFLEKVITVDSAILLKASNSMKFSEIYNEISKKLK